jgi:hypothetical protein
LSEKTIKDSEGKIEMILSRINFEATKMISSRFNFDATGDLSGIYPVMD